MSAYANHVTMQLLNRVAELEKAKESLEEKLTERQEQIRKDREESEIATKRITEELNKFQDQVSGQYCFECTVIRASE